MITVFFTKGSRKCIAPVFGKSLTSRLVNNANQYLFSVCVMYDHVILVHIGENEPYQFDPKIIIIFNNYFNYYYCNINFPTE